MALKLLRGYGSQLINQPRQPFAALLSAQIRKMAAEQRRASSDYQKFREIFRRSRRIVALTGAGISAESGVPTFRGTGGLWRRYRAQELASPDAFSRNPALVWQFYAYRRELVLTKQPNQAHYTLAEVERKLEQRNDGSKLTIITQNIDELHRRAGSRNVIEVHGTLFRTRCTRCGDVAANRDSPICSALANVTSSIDEQNQELPSIQQLPHCKKSGCDGLLRPHVVWFGESLDAGILEQCQRELDACDLCLVIGTSSIVYPAAMFAPQVAVQGIPVAEFNIEATPSTPEFGFHFKGPCGTTLPAALRTD